MGLRLRGIIADAHDEEPLGFRGIWAVKNYLLKPF
jgi:hypothetical protein